MQKKHFLFCVLLLTIISVGGGMNTAVAHPAYQTAGWRFGVVESYENPAAATTLGVGWTRVKFHWAIAQQGGPGTWTPDLSEEKINSELAAGRTVVGLLIGLPEWANEDGLPRGLALPHDDPNNSWGVFVQDVVGRYDGRINHWIIWNEPDIGDANAPGHTWNGTIEQFVQLQRTAYLMAKQTNPNAIIHLPAFTHFWDPDYIYNFLDVVVTDPSAADNDYYFDVVTAHLYFQPDSIYTLIQSFAGAVNSRGIPSKPLWLVETNAPPIDDPAWPVPNYTFVVTQYEQAAFVPQGLASALAAGAQRIAIYKMQDTPTDIAANPEPFGLLRMDGTRRPAFTTYQVAIQYMSGMTAVKRTRWNEVGQIELEQEGKQTAVLFSRLPFPQQATVEAVSETAVLVDMWGERQTITARDGVFTVDLPAALCAQTAGDYCMIGGTVYYLVQSSDGGDPPAAPAAPALPQAGATATPTSPPTPTSTPQPATPTATATPTMTATPTLSNEQLTAVSEQMTVTSEQMTVVSQQETETAVPQHTNTPIHQYTNTPASIAAIPATSQPAQPISNNNASNGLSYWLLGGAFGLTAVLATLYLKTRQRH